MSLSHKVSVICSLLIIKALREQEIGRQIFILLTRKVGLDYESFRETKGFQLQ